MYMQITTHLLGEQDSESNQWWLLNQHRGAVEFFAQKLSSWAAVEAVDIVD